MNITLIAAIGLNNELGKDNKLIWHIPEDMKFFKDNTMSKTIVMGMNTLKSLPKLLPGRKHIVLTRQEIKLPQEIMVFHNIKDLLDYIEKLNQEVMVIGGAQIYKELINYANKMLLTKIEEEANADAYFPDFNKNEWIEQVLSEHNYDNISYKHLEYKRKK